MPERGAIDLGSKRRQQFSLDDRQQATAGSVKRNEVRAIVGGVELAAKAHVPSRRIGERGNAARDRRSTSASAVASGISGIARWSGLHDSRRDREIVSRCGAAAASCSSAPASVSPQRNFNTSVRPPFAVASTTNLHAAVNRKDAPAIVESDPRVDRGAIEQMFAQRRAAMIGGNARGQDQPDASGRPASAATRAPGTIDSGWRARCPAANRRATRDRTAMPPSCWPWPRRDPPKSPCRRAPCPTAGCRARHQSRRRVSAARQRRRTLPETPAPNERRRGPARLARAARIDSRSCAAGSVVGDPVAAAIHSATTPGRRGGSREPRP